MLERTTSAKKAKSVFFEDTNTIDIYIEDTAIGYKKIFKTILNRLLGEKFLINNVFPLGGRLSVISQWEEDKNKRNRPRIYIIDGDLNLLLEERVCAPGLYILPFYCIENIFLCEESLVNLMVEEDAEREDEELRALLNFTAWEDRNRELLIDLFVTYALAKKHTPTIPSVSYKVSNLIRDNKGFLDEEKTRSRIQQLYDQMKFQAGEEKIIKDRSDIYARIGEGNSLKKYISGKDYLMPLITLRLKSIIDTRLVKLTMKHRISSRCDITDIQDLENFILS